MPVLLCLIRTRDEFVSNWKRAPPVPLGKLYSSKEGSVIKTFTIPAPRKL